MRKNRKSAFCFQPTNKVKSDSNAILLPLHRPRNHRRAWWDRSWVQVHVAIGRTTTWHHQPIVWKPNRTFWMGWNDFDKILHRRDANIHLSLFDNDISLNNYCLLVIEMLFIRRQLLTMYHTRADVHLALDNCGNCKLWILCCCIWSHPYGGIYRCTRLGGQDV